MDRSKIQLMVKIGMDTRCPVDKTGTSWINRADTEGIRADVDYALETLGTDYIDVIVLCRVSPTVPIEESVTAMKVLPPLAALLEKILSMMLLYIHLPLKIYQNAKII